MQEKICIPVIISCYSNLFSIEWEEYLKDIREYFGKETVIITNTDNQIVVLLIRERDFYRTAETKKECEILIEKSQKKYHNKTKIRDLAILTLLLGTGIRVSECVGIDISNLDFETNGMKIHRKGGADVILYFGEEVREALLDYLEEREKIIPKEGSEDALFLSMQKRRISVRAVENLVKKYARPVTPLKTITPHKLRSTYGTQLYQETGDIYLVADVLGHKDVNTTRKHYAAMEDQRRRMAAGKIQLREK